MGKKAVSPDRTRIVALVGHRSAGKTSLGELLLHETGATRSVGRVLDGTSLLDHGLDERSRHKSLSPAFAWLHHRDHLIHLVDTPGSDGIAYGRALAVAGVDAAVVVINGPEGVQLGTESVLRETVDLPTLLVANKWDRVQASREGMLPTWRGLLSELAEETGGRAALVQLPWFDDRGVFAGVVDLVERRLLVCGESGVEERMVPSAHLEAMEAARETLVEAVALASDELLERYLEYLELPVEDIKRGLAYATARRAVMPVLFTSATAEVGGVALLDQLLVLVPPAAPSAENSAASESEGPREGRGRKRKKKRAPSNPAEPFVAQWIATLLDEDNEPYRVLRVRSGQAPHNGRWLHPGTGTPVRVSRLYQVRGPRRTVAVNTGPGAIVATWDVLPGKPGDTFTDGAEVQLPCPSRPDHITSLLVRPGHGEPTERFESALNRILALDPALRKGVDPLTNGTLLVGYSSAHLSLALDRLRRRFNLKVQTALPPVAYHESPTVGVHMAHGVHRRAVGGDSIVVAEVWLNISPRSVSDGFRYVSEVDEFVLPERFVEAAGHGALVALTRGPLGGYPVVGLEVLCVGGDYNVLESTESDFEVAGRLAMSAALDQSATRLLEPWSTVRLSAPSDSVGGLLADITSHRGRIVGMEMLEELVVIMAEVPNREFQTFDQRLEAHTHGRGAYTRKPLAHAPLPPELVRDTLRGSPLRKPSSTNRMLRQQAETTALRGAK